MLTLIYGFYLLLTIALSICLYVVWTRGFVSGQSSDIPLLKGRSTEKLSLDKNVVRLQVLAAFIAQQNLCRELLPMNNAEVDSFNKALDELERASAKVWGSHPDMKN